MNTQETVIAVLAELSGCENVELSSTLTGDLGLDSMLMVSMLIEFEASFNIEFDESDMNPYDLETVSDAVELVVRYVGE